MATNKVVYAGTTLIDLSNDTVTSDKILDGYTAHDASGDTVTGTIPTKTSSDVGSSGSIITIPSGYYPSSVSKSVNTAEQATPSISVDSSGKITASSTQSEGYVSAGTKSSVQFLTGQQGKTVTPSASQQIAVMNGVYTTGIIYVAGDADLTPENIKSGTSIFGVTGTYVDSTPIEISTDADMNAVLTSENVGKVYKFTGTSDTYTNGDLYIVEVG